MILWRHRNSSYPSTSAPLTSAPFQRVERSHVAYCFQSQTEQSPGMCRCMTNRLLLRGCISWFKGITVLPFANLCLNRETNRSLPLTSLDFGLSLAMTSKYIFICKLSWRSVFPGWPILFFHKDFFLHLFLFPFNLPCYRTPLSRVQQRIIFWFRAQNLDPMVQMWERGKKKRQSISEALEKIKSVEAETTFALCCF